MGSPAFKWTPKGEASVQTLTFPWGLQMLQGLRDADVVRSVSKGGVAVSVVWDTFAYYDLEFRGFGPVNQAAFFAGLTSWWSHAGAGGIFQFLMDGTKTADTTTSATMTQGATTFSVNSTATMATGDWIHIEDVTDQSKWERRSITNISGSTLTVNTGVTYGFGRGATVRHVENLVRCIAIDKEAPFVEREAGRGPNLWDLRLKFRTVR
jgi:hypothetical protein